MGYRRAWVALMLFAVNIINYMDRVALSVAATPIAAEFGFSPVTMGYLFSSFLWLYVLCLVPVGLMVDRFGAKRVMSGGVSIWSLATMFTGLGWSFPSILIARLTMGVGESVGYPVAARVIREWIPEGERGQVTMLFNSGSFAGPAFGAILVGWLVGQFGWRMAFIALGLLGFLWLCFWLIVFDAPERVSWLGRAERDKILAERHGRGLRGVVEGAPRSSLGHLLGQPTTWGIALTQATITYNGYLFLTWLPSYLQGALHLSSADTGVFTAIPYLVTLVLGMLIARLSDRLLPPALIRRGGRRFFVVGGMFVGLLVLAAPDIQSTWGLLTLISVVLTGLNTGSSLNLTLVNDLTDNPRDAARAMSLAVFGGNFCGAIAPIVTGYVVAATSGFFWAFRIASLILIVGMVLCLSLSRGRIRAQHDVQGALHATTVA